jgi:hypothetical protein
MLYPHIFSDPSVSFVITIKNKTSTLLEQPAFCIFTFYGKRFCTIYFLPPTGNNVNNAFVPADSKVNALDMLLLQMRNIIVERFILSQWRQL